MAHALPIPLPVTVSLSQEFARKGNSTYPLPLPKRVRRCPFCQGVILTKMPVCVGMVWGRKIVLLSRASERTRPFMLGDIQSRRLDDLHLQIGAVKTTDHL